IGPDQRDSTGFNGIQLASNGTQLAPNGTELALNGIELAPNGLQPARAGGPSGSADSMAWRFQAGFLRRSPVPSSAPPTISAQAAATCQLASPWPNRISSRVDISGAA